MHVPTRGTRLAGGQHSLGNQALHLISFQALRLGCLGHNLHPSRLESEETGGPMQIDIPLEPQALVIMVEEKTRSSRTLFNGTS